MLLVIIGGSGSGKSAYAERRLCDLAEDGRVYLATMRVLDEESRGRVLRHRKLREGRRFQLIEQPVDLAQLSFDGTQSVLLEDLPMLLSNEMFRTDGKEPKPCRLLLGELLQLKDSVRNLVVVTGNLFEDGIVYDEATTRYLETLGRLNRALCHLADERVEVVYGIPLAF